MEKLRLYGAITDDYPIGQVRFCQCDGPGCFCL